MASFVVVIDEGAVTPMELLISLADHHVVYAHFGTAYAREAESLLSAENLVIELQDDNDECLNSIEDLAPSGIVTFSEPALRATAGLARRLGLPYHSEATARRLTDKHLQRRALRDAGVDESRSVLLTDASTWPEAFAEVGGPVVVKPARGAASRDTHLISNVDDGADVVGRLLNIPGTQLVVEEYLAGQDMWPYGDYVSVESALHRGSIVHIGITGKLPQLPPFRETGQFVPDCLPLATSQEVLELTSRALRALQVEDGLTHTEIKLTPHGPRIIEVNGRIGGHIHELYGRAFQIDLVQLAADLATGGRLPTQPPVPTSVHFQYTTQPPLEASRLVAADGRRQIKAHHGIVRYHQFVSPGSALPADSRTFDLDLVCGNAADHQSMLTVLSSCLKQTSFTFDTPTGPATYSGAKLGGTGAWSA